MEYQLTRQKIGELLRIASGKIFLPNVLLVFLFTILNWIVVGAFLYFKWDEISDLKFGIIMLYGGTFPAFSYGIWAVRRSLIQLLELVYTEILIHFFRNFLEDVATGLFHLRESGASVLKDDGKLDSYNLVLRFRNWLNPKLELLPSWLKKLILFVLRKMNSAFDFQEMMSEFENSTDSRKKIQEKIELKVFELYQSIVRKVVPGWTNLLIVLNIALMLFLFFY
ncbi:MAG: hypothetical protein R2799_07490 [Crocinitomicaceae bacterium]